MQMQQHLQVHRVFQRLSMSLEVNLSVLGFRSSFLILQLRHAIPAHRNSESDTLLDLAHVEKVRHKHGGGHQRAEPNPAGDVFTVPLMTSQRAALMSALAITVCNQCM